MSDTKGSTPEPIRPALSAFRDWAIASALLIIAIVTAWSIGIFVLPFALVALGVAAYRTRSQAGSLWGIPFGVGSVLLIVGLLHTTSTPCRQNGNVAVLGPGQSSSCGGISPMPWAVGGAIACATGIFGFRARRRERKGTSPT